MDTDQYEHSAATYPEFSDYHHGEEVFIKTPRHASRHLVPPISKGSAGPPIVGSLVNFNESFANLEMTDALYDQMIIVGLFIMLLICCYIVRSISTLAKDVKKIKDMLKIISARDPSRA